MEEEEIELLPHTFGDWVEEVKASCLETGKKGHYICEGCQTIFDQNKIILEDLTISALGHNIMSYEGKQATCTESGWASYEACSRCSYTTYREISALGHQEVIDLSIAATCTTPGSTEGSHCSICNIVMVQPSNRATRAYVWFMEYNSRSDHRRIWNRKKSLFSQWYAYRTKTTAKTNC